MRLACCLIALAVVLTPVSPVLAQDEPTQRTASGSEGNLGWYGWGLRAGLADSPDQVLFERPRRSKTDAPAIVLATSSVKLSPSQGRPAADSVGRPALPEQPVPKGRAVAG